jgi:predicted TIM-barrel fold metal-dependent hydrolase
MLRAHRSLHAIVALSSALVTDGCGAQQNRILDAGTAEPKAGDSRTPERSRIVPVVDHHQHLVSRGTAAMINGRQRPGSPPQEPITAARLVQLLDSAGIQRAVVLSGAFTFGGRNFDPERQTLSEDELYARVRAENDWTAREAAAYPDRLIAFCSFHPQAAAAIAEIRRCASNPVFKGVKLHLEESDVDLTDPAQAEQVRLVFSEANRLKLPIVIHPRTNRADARATTEAFLTRVLPAAPDVPVQVAHLHGGGAYSEAALSLYAEAVASGSPATRRLLFDVTDIALTARGAGAQSQATMETITALMRRIGLDRMLYGSDPAVFGRAAPREGWAEFRAVMPLTDEELAIIAQNVAPYLR